ncbi:UNVERIFIED_CONTAM: Calcium load-activated calcium channel [Sesamum calycinum]|uniref:Calcium load-activated calcium channel n=1 Tax=Sesamum calycinum TaxID=2727403 RepID=A0AAW2RUA4_9LAMI
MSHRGLPGDDMTDCSMAFLYLLCSISIRTNLQKFLGFSPPRGAAGAGLFPMPDPKSINGRFLLKLYRPISMSGHGNSQFYKPPYVPGKDYVLFTVTVPSGLFPNSALIHELLNDEDILGQYKRHESEIPLRCATGEMKKDSLLQLINWGILFLLA